MTFSLSSPLAKFLNGLEILLTKAQVGTAALFCANAKCFEYSCVHLEYVIFMSACSNFFCRFEPSQLPRIGKATLVGLCP